MKIPGEYFDRFFESMVGDPEAIATFQANLGDYVAVGEAIGADPYSALEFGVKDIMAATVWSHVKQDGPIADPIEQNFWPAVEANAKLGGAGMTVAALRAVGVAYAQHANVPQAENLVQQNTERVLRHVLSVAYLDRIASTLTVESTHTGMSPRNWLNLAMVAVSSNTKFSYARALTVESGEDGQLRLDLRHKRRKPLRNRQCPSVYSRVTDENGQQKSALWTFLQTVGTVAVTEIYPNQFEIISAES